MVAAEHGHVAVCDYLIRRGARLDLTDVEGRSPIANISSRYRNVMVLRSAWP